MVSSDLGVAQDWTKRDVEAATTSTLPRQLSDKVLTERLRDPVSLGLVTHRKGEGRTSSDIYTLAARGRSLINILRLLYEWGTENAAEFHVKVGEMLSRDKARH